MVAWWASDLPLRLLTTPPSNRPIDATTYSHIYVPGRVAELVPKHHRALVLGCVGHSHSDARAHEKVWNVGDHAEDWYGFGPEGPWDGGVSRRCSGAGMAMAREVVGAVDISAAVAAAVAVVGVKVGSCGARTRRGSD